jgi:hypothetical protein
MFWGAYSNSMIVKYDKAVHKVMDGLYAVLMFELLEKEGGVVILYGYYLIYDGGYPKFKFLVCPFKWPETGTTLAFWSEVIESAIKDTERCFGSIKK